MVSGASRLASFRQLLALRNRKILNRNWFTVIWLFESLALSYRNLGSISSIRVDFMMPQFAKNKLIN